MAARSETTAMRLSRGTIGLLILRSQRFSSCLQVIREIIKSIIGQRSLRRTMKAFLNQAINLQIVQSGIQPLHLPCTSFRNSEHTCCKNKSLRIKWLSLTFKQSSTSGSSHNCMTPWTLQLTTASFSSWKLLIPKRPLITIYGYFSKSKLSKRMRVSKQRNRKIWMNSIKKLSGTPRRKSKFKVASGLRSQRRKTDDF